MCLKIKKKEVISINIEEGKFYFIKNEFFDKFNNKEMCLNKKDGNKRPFLIQNMFPTLKEYIIEKYIKQQRDVVINKELKKELNKKANKILKLVEKGYKNLVFSDIIKIRRLLIEEIKSN